MVARLVADAIRRSGQSYGTIAPILVLGWLAYLATGESVFGLSMTGLSLIAVAVAGPALAMSTMGGRELRHLPVSNRDLWRATWVIAVPIAAGLFLCTKSISWILAGAGTPKVPAETMLLSSVYDFAWAGVMLQMFVAIGIVMNSASARGTAGKYLAVIAAITLPALAFLVLPILLGLTLPADLRHFTWPTAVVVGVGLAIAFGGLMWTPSRDSMSRERSVHATTARIRIQPRLRPADRLTGISRMLVPYVLSIVALTALGALALAIWGAAAGWGVWWFTSPLDSDNSLSFALWVPCMWATLTALWAPWARTMKTLPLSVMQINALMLITPLLSWTILWLLVLIARLTPVSPPMLQFQFIIGMGGCGAFAQAGMLRFQGNQNIAFMPGVMTVILTAMIRTAATNGSGQFKYVVIGAIALCLAAAWNHHTLTRSTSADVPYQRPREPIAS